MSLNPDIKKNAVDAACYRALRAMLAEQRASIKQGGAFNSHLALAAALEVIAARQPDSVPFTLQDCITHLRASAAPRRARGRAAGAEGLR